MKKGRKNHPHFPSVEGRKKTREIHATCKQLEEEENPTEPCALPGNAFTVSLQSACPGVQPASPRTPGDRSAPAAASAAAAAAGSRRGTRADGERERERTARERREGRKRVITRGRRGSGPARRRAARGLGQHGRPWASPGQCPAAGGGEGPRGEATRRPISLGEKGAQGALGSPELGLRLGVQEPRRPCNGALGPQSAPRRRRARPRRERGVVPMEDRGGRWDPTAVRSARTGSRAALGRTC